MTRIEIEELRRQRCEHCEMRVRQYAYFAIRSDDTDPDEITRRIGIAADDARARHSRDSVQRLPRCHHWNLRSGVDRDRSLNEHFDALLVRVGPRVAGIRNLVAKTASHAWLQVVRNFEEGEEDLDAAPESAPLLGFGVDDRLLNFLCETDAVRCRRVRLRTEIY